MAGRFVRVGGAFRREAFRTKGLSDLEWKLFEDIFPQDTKKNFASTLLLSETRSERERLVLTDTKANDECALA